MNRLDTYHLSDILVTLGVWRGVNLASLACRGFYIALQDDAVWACWLIQEFAQQQFLLSPDYNSARNNLIRIWTACCDALRGRKLLYRGLWTQGDWAYSC